MAGDAGNVIIIYPVMNGEVPMDTEIMSRRLKLVAIANFIFAASFALGALPALNLPAMLFADIVIWPINGPESGTDPVARLMLAISGGVIAALGAIWFTASGKPCREAPHAVKHMLITGAVTWFVVDSIGSLLAGAPLNVLGNILFLGVLVWPFWRLPVQEGTVA